jgi:hypothetical protein
LLAGLVFWQSLLAGFQCCLGVDGPNYGPNFKRWHRLGLLTAVPTSRASPGGASAVRSLIAGTRGRSNGPRHQAIVMW